MKIPACGGDSYTTFRTRLQDAGFTGTITQQTVGADDAIMEEQADRVTATSPATGSQAVYDADISVYVNPDPMPQMTAQQTLIADALKDKQGQRGRYGAFVSTCKLAERKAVPTPLNGGGNFLLIPQPKGAPNSAPSLSLCHGTNP